MAWGQRGATTLVYERGATALSQGPADSSVEAIAQGMVERAIEFMASRLNMNALLAQADLNAALGQVDINELLARIDIQELADRVGVDRLVAGMDVKSLEAAQKVLTKQLLLRRRPAQTPPGITAPARPATTDVDTPCVTRLDDVAYSRSCTGQINCDGQKTKPPNRVNGERPVGGTATARKLPVEEQTAAALPGASTVPQPSGSLPRGGLCQRCIRILVL